MSALKCNPENKSGDKYVDSTLIQLPTEILVFIMSFLMPKSTFQYKQCMPIIAELSTVCKVFNNVATGVYSNQLLAYSKRSQQSDSHHSLFSAYLRSPSINSSFEAFGIMSIYSNGRSGILDIKNIAKHREEILTRIVPVMYKQKYGPEESLVVVRDKMGDEVARLEWTNERFYDEYAQ